MFVCASYVKNLIISDNETDNQRRIYHLRSNQYQVNRYSNIKDISRKIIFDIMDSAENVKTRGNSISDQDVGLNMSFLNFFPFVGSGYSLEQLISLDAKIAKGSPLQIG